jgi:coenzyme F420-0:L-glutamate ligase/coenzyme F420-1:gamma-L-glutamate ligase
VIGIFAPDGIGEIRPGDDLAGLIATALASCPEAPLADGDVVVVTSKAVSKAEGRVAPANQREALVAAETARTVARRDRTRIVRTVRGLTTAAAGVDTSNMPAGRVLLLPADPDASAARLCQALRARSGARVGVVISDTAGRAWRLGQTDQAIGAAGLRVLERYAGRTDPYGNELAVTAMALADELAGAADLAKGKLRGRPVAVVRGLVPDLTAEGVSEPASTLLRPPEQDMFGYGSREAVLAAVCRVTGCAAAYEELVALDGEELVAAVLARAGRSGGEADLLAELLRASAYPAVTVAAG